MSKIMSKINRRDKPPLPQLQASDWELQAMTHLGANDPSCSAFMYYGVDIAHPNGRDYSVLYAKERKTGEIKPWAGSSAD